MATILCIDNDLSFLELEKSVLETNGFTVLIASDGPAAIALACDNAVDVVVLAFKMPELNGPEVADRLFEQQPDLPVIICTDYFNTVPERILWLASECVDKRDGLDVLVYAIQKATRLSLTTSK